MKLARRHLPWPSRAHHQTMGTLKASLDVEPLCVNLPGEFADISKDTIEFEAKQNYRFVLRTIPTSIRAGAFTGRGFDSESMPPVQVQELTSLSCG
jgi:hypothetical protein